MSVSLGAGWRLVHLTDRCIDLRKEDAAYRSEFGHDGYVRVRGEPGMDRAALIELARTKAQESDAALAERIGQQIVLRNVPGFQARQRAMAWTFGTPEDPEIIGVRRP